MGLLSFLSKKEKKPKQNYEVSKTDYFTNYLNNDDSMELSLFLSKFIKRLPIESAILAVGSTTFPKTHWDFIKKLNEQNPDLEASESYNDIDLLIVPYEKTDLENLKNSTRKTLDLMHYESLHSDCSPMGVRYIDSFHVTDNKSEKTIVPFADFGYGIHSISTKLKNKRSLDLILGRDDLLEITANEKIELERKNNVAFSIVYEK